MDITQTMRMEVETGLSRVWLHVYTQSEYLEDYQMPMLRNNRIIGLLPIEGCEVEGKGRYTYDISGLISLRTLFQKNKIKQKDIESITAALLETAESLYRYMLNPDCLLLQPEYIFKKGDKCYFCYLPGYNGTMASSFHELSEYFLKMLDYEDTEGIFLAYELHKATLQEHYDLAEIMRSYQKRKKNRKEEWEKEQRNKESRQEKYGNLFSLAEEEDGDEKTRTSEETFQEQKQYEIHPAADTVREEGGWQAVWKKATRHLPGKRWGQWNDLIMETDGEKG